MTFTIQSNDTAFHIDQSRWYDTDIAILLAALAGNGVKSGCGVTAQGSPNMTVAVASGTIYAAGAEVAVTSGNVTVGTADGTNPRMDLITASAAGVKTITAGTAAAAPKPPALPSGHIGLAMVYVPAGITAIASNKITDKTCVMPPPQLVVEELDASPTHFPVSKIVFPNGTVAFTGDVATITGFGMSNPMIQGGDIVTATGAANWATIANGASASGDGGDNSATGMIDSDDSTHYDTYRNPPAYGGLPQSDRIVIDLGSVRSVGSVRFRQGIGGSSGIATHIKFEYSTDTGSTPTTWVTIDADRTLVSGDNVWSLTEAISARHWRIECLNSNVNGAAWIVNTWELRNAGAEVPLRLAAGPAKSVLASTGTSGQALAYVHPTIPTKAGVPTDADTLTTAADGMMILDTTNHRLYIRDGGTWKYAALT